MKSRRAHASPEVAWIAALVCVICAALPMPTHAHQHDARIAPWEQDPRYWQVDGSPVLLLGGSKDDNLFQIPDLEAHLLELRSAGGNYIRNTMSDRRDGGFEVYPFEQLDDGRYDLRRWNDEYWNRLDRLLHLTALHRIVVQIEVWDRFDYVQQHWEEHPYNPRNNVNYSSGSSGFAEHYPGEAMANEQPFFTSIPDLADNRTVLAFQQRFVDKLLSHTLRYGHVLYCISNETSGAEAWSTYWAEYVQRRADEAGYPIFITEMWDAWNLREEIHRRTLDHPDRYGFVEASQNNHMKGQEHWDNLQWVRQRLAAHPRPLNAVKTYGADGGRFGTTRDGLERWWRQLIGGAAAVRFHRPESGLGLSDPALASLRAARKLESRIRLWEVEPANHLLHDREQDEAYLAAKPGVAYALYLTEGGSVGLDLRNVQNRFDLHWIDVAAGDWGEQRTIEGGSVVRIAAPGDGQWVAAITRRR